MKPAPFRWLAVWLLATGMVWAAQGDVRFSNTLNAEERAASGLTRLSSDEVAVIDALVRRDTTARAGSTTNDEKPATFSQRLTAGERDTAGFQKLTAKELPQLDSFVDRFQNAKLARSLLAPPVYLARRPGITPAEMKKELEIHGSFSLSYGFGSGGYSEKTGSMVLTLDDPARRFSISVGYSESHVKGGHIYSDPFYGRGSLYDRDPFYGRDPFYDYNDPFYRPGRILPEGAVIERP
jgi:hypothetical protein